MSFKGVVDENNVDLWAAVAESATVRSQQSPVKVSTNRKPIEQRREERRLRKLAKMERKEAWLKRKEERKRLREVRKAQKAQNRQQRLAEKSRRKSRCIARIQLVDENTLGINFCPASCGIQTGPVGCIVRTLPGVQYRPAQAMWYLLTCLFLLGKTQVKMYGLLRCVFSGRFH